MQYENSLSASSCLVFAIGLNMDKSKGTASKSISFTDKIRELRDRARAHIESGAVTPSYEGDLETSIQILNEALATELVCTLRYKYHYFSAEGIHSKDVAEEFLEHANEEQEHADRIARRITQLGGKPDLNPETLTLRSHAEYKEGDSLLEMIREDLIAERIAIESYREMIQYFGNKDSTSRRLMESILAKEEEHAEELSSLLSTLDHRERSSEAA
jgi:bacterioferritin